MRRNSIGGGCFDNTPLGATLAHIWRNRKVLNVGLGMICGTVAGNALTVWSPSFLIRVHGYTLQQAGFAAAMVVGLVGAVGAVIGGSLSDRLARNDPGRRMLTCIVGPLLSAVALWGACFVESGQLALALLALTVFLIQFMYGPGYAAILSLTPAGMRGTTMSAYLIATNFIAVNVGTMSAGWLADVLKPRYGAHSIAVALAGLGVFNLLAALFFWRAMALMKRDGLAA